MSTSPNDGKSFNSLISASSYRDQAVSMQRPRNSFVVSAMEAQLRSIELLSAKEQELAQRLLMYKTGIRSQRDALVALRSSRRRLEMYLHACGFLSSPIQRLPLEVLSEIFTHFCGTIRLSADEVSYPVLILAAVCGRWRDLAFSTSWLWTRIDVEATSSLSLRRLRGFEALVDLALENSRGLPLDLDLSDDSEICIFESTQGKQDVVISIMISVACHAHRWRRVSLALSDDVLDEMNSVVRDFPLLESLTSFRGPPPFNLVNTAPKLRHLSVHIRTLSPLRPVLKVPWNQISTLNICTCGFKASIFKLLACVDLCTCLQQLRIDCLGFSRESLDRAWVTQTMQSLILTDLFWFDLETVLGSLILPQLTQLSLIRVLDLDHDITWSDPHERAIKNLLMRSSCTITSLTLVQVPISDEKLISLLRLLPSVEKLSIEQIEGEVDTISERFIDSLRIPPSSACALTKAEFQPLLPNLREIQLTMIRDGAPSSEALVEFVKSRWIPYPADASALGVACLKSVAFRYDYGDIDQDFHELTCLREAGMEFTATTES